MSACSIVSRPAARVARWHVPEEAGRGPALQRSRLRSGPSNAHDQRRRTSAEPRWPVHRAEPEYVFLVCVVQDIGAGQGYLSRTLCHRPDRPASPPVASPPPIQVLAIDGSPTQIRGSQAFGDKASTASPITYLVQRIEGADSASSEISSWLTTRGDGRGIIIGLHACGKLTDDTIGMFLRTEGIKGLVVVGCESGAQSIRVRPKRRTLIVLLISLTGCYNHLGSGPGPGCFPTSALFKELQVALSSTARMAGCQNVTRWEDDPASTPQALQKREELRRVSRER